MNIDVLLDYVRMVAYVFIILSSLGGIMKRKFNTILFVGDIIIAMALLTSGLLGTFVSSELNVRDYIFTPAVIFWAIIHYISFIKYNNGNTA